MTSPNDLPSITELIKQGVAALKSGDRATAQHLLSQAVKRQPDHELAWLWLAGAVSGPDERRSCLERVLTLNADNAMAKQGLAQLPQPQEFVPSSTPEATTPLAHTNSAMPPAEEIHTNGVVTVEPNKVENMLRAAPLQPLRQPEAEYLRPVQLGALESVIPERDDRAIQILTAMLGFILFVVVVGIVYVQLGRAPAPSSDISENAILLIPVAYHQIASAWRFLKTTFQSLNA
ncbi:MAG: hypothetical protein AAGF95_17570 [Chloroflexota bacterium]